MGKPAGSKAALLDEIARVGKALGNGRRLQILDLLAQGERTVDAIATATGMNLTTASANLQSLKAGGLVETRRDGTRQYYRLAGEDVGRLFSLVQTVAEAHLADVAVAAAAVLGSPEDAITRQELIRRLDAGEVTLIDVRPHEEYSAGHIPGAISMPLAELVDRLSELPAGQEIVAYCRGAYCVMAPEAARIVKSAGRVVKRLDEGMLEWRLAGLPVEEPTGQAG
ncbi:metalloregulator ArsR/SmtB family transcription factor [Mycobacterium sp. SP-6446]|uniref:ArsR/SmtB family transcription factor n=1 Tax=Mycobacterium sp. SP-6446 TaxID=1834162 RepID=UPI00096CDA86|nr:metalloregulator ArsR/SmtB family transcription factor [Mycobacterium sp. SP-6446]OMC21525.1 ArsR family transcriptional regulator [Mycobacterium sp. SP-6446]